MLKALLVATSLLALSSPAFADQTLDDHVTALAHAWDHANFEIQPAGAKLAELQRLEGVATALARQYPNQAEPIVWQAIVISSEAGVQGGLGALGKAGQARDLLQHAEQINPNALNDGSIYTSLGSLYYEVPGFPLGFGDRDRARRYLQRALQINPNGIEPNYFMADFLMRQHDYVHAADYLRRAIAAPSRPGREIADAARRHEATAMLAQATARAH